MAKVVVLVSGGMDSAVLLWLLKKDNDVHALSVHYGQRHAKELAAAKILCEIAKVSHQEIDLRAVRVLLSGSSQTDDQVAVPTGHYADPVMRLTVVPNRNMMMLSVAAAAAIGWGGPEPKAVAFAAHAGDHPVYPDCREEFVAALGGAMRLCHYDGGVSLVAPFLDKTKADLAKLGAELRVPFAKTWSCYCGEERHCGRCGTCVERREAFHLAGVPDPTEYAE